MVQRQGPTSDQRNGTTTRETAKIVAHRRGEPRKGITRKPLQSLNCMGATAEYRRPAPKGETEPESTGSGGQVGVARVPDQTETDVSVEPNQRSPTE